MEDTDIAASEGLVLGAESIVWLVYFVLPNITRYAHLQGIGLDNVGLSFNCAAKPGINSLKFSYSTRAC